MRHQQCIYTTYSTLSTARMSCVIREGRIPAFPQKPPCLPSYMYSKMLSRGHRKNSTSSAPIYACIHNERWVDKSPTHPTAPALRMRARHRTPSTTAPRPRSGNGSRAKPEILQHPVLPRAVVQPKSVEMALAAYPAWDRKGSGVSAPLIPAPKIAGPPRCMGPIFRGVANSARLKKGPPHTLPASPSGQSPRPNGQEQGPRWGPNLVPLVI